MHLCETGCLWYLSFLLIGCQFIQSKVNLKSRVKFVLDLLN